MNTTTLGWIGFIASMGFMCTLLAGDIAALTSWSQVLEPKFVALFMAHLGVVISSFISGKIMPPDRDVTERTRKTDPPKVA